MSDCADKCRQRRDCVQAALLMQGATACRQHNGGNRAPPPAGWYRNVSPAPEKAKGANVVKSPHPNRFYLPGSHAPTTAVSSARDCGHSIVVVYSGSTVFFEWLKKGVGPEEAVGLFLPQRPCEEQFHTTYPHRPEEDLLLPASTSLIKYVGADAKGGRKVYVHPVDFPLMEKYPWHCADIPFGSHNTDLSASVNCTGEGSKNGWKRKFLAL